MVAAVHGSGIVFLDSTVVNVALPKIGQSLPSHLFDTLEAASAEGIKRVEFLGGAERYKLELADGIEPLYEAVGLARGPVGRLRAGARVGEIRLRRRLKASPAVMRVLGRAQQSSARS